MIDVETTFAAFESNLACLRLLRECHAITEIERSTRAESLLNVLREVATLASSNGAEEGERLVAGLVARFCEDASKGAELFEREWANGGFAPGYTG